MTRDDYIKELGQMSNERRVFEALVDILFELRKMNGVDEPLDRISAYVLHKQKI